MSRIEDREKWDALHAARPLDEHPVPCRLLSEWDRLLPASGDALDLACGAGGNALLLAGRGLRVTACDLSSAATRRVRERALRDGQTLEIVTGDGAAALQSASRYDVIVTSRFLDRCLMPLIVRALRPKGLLYYQTFTVDTPPGRGPRNPLYKLKRRELIRTFGAFDVQVLFYSEENGEACLIARKS